MSFKTRVSKRLQRWIELNPGAPKDAIDRKARSIARRLKEAEDEEKRRDR